MRLRELLLLFLVTVTLSACGGGSGGSATTPPAPTTGTTINSYDVTGQTPLANDVIPINPGLSNGEFFATWQATSSDPFRVRLYVSEDQTLDAAVSDVRIYSNTCGSSISLFTCRSIHMERCLFGNNNRVRCGTVSATNPEQDLTVFLNTIPKDAFVIIEACDFALTDCKTETHAVQFQ